MSILIEGPSDQRMPSTALAHRKLPLDLKRLLINYQEESLHVVNNRAVNDNENNGLAVDQKHVNN